jgi:hypothetical protein
MGEVDKQGRYLVTLNDDDILCGSGSVTGRHPGNIKFRKIVAKYFGQYFKASTKSDKMSVSRTILAEVLETGGRFLKRDSFNHQNWFVADINVGKDKISHALRLLKKVLQEEEQSKHRELLALNGSCEPLQLVEQLIPSTFCQKVVTTGGAVRLFLTDTVSKNDPQELLLLPHAAVGTLVGLSCQHEFFRLNDRFGPFDLPSSALSHLASSQHSIASVHNRSWSLSHAWDNLGGSHQQPLILRSDPTEISGTYDHGHNHTPWNLSTSTSTASTRTTGPPSRVPPLYLDQQPQHQGSVTSSPRDSGGHRYARESDENGSDLRSSTLGTDLFDRPRQQQRHPQPSGTSFSRKTGKSTCSNEKNCDTVSTDSVNNVGTNHNRDQHPNEISYTPRYFRNDSKRKWRAPPNSNRELQEGPNGYDSGYMSDDTIAWFVASIYDDSEDAASIQTLNERSARPHDRKNRTSSDSCSSSWKLSRTMSDHATVVAQIHKQERHRESNFHRRTKKRFY